MSLYQKYRPTTFEEMIGNEEQIESLSEMLQRKNRPHVYLLAGESGCGKTTAARIAAKIVGAGELSTREINTANNRGIDTARDIIEQMRNLPIDGTATAFIIDEVHKTTGDWQNAMLKATEDTPAHVYFFLCTTEPKKLIPTLQKRCQLFTFKPIPEDFLKRLVKGVAKQEGITLTPEVAEEIAEKANGSARTSLVILEKVTGMEPEKALKLIKDFVTAETPEIIDLCRALIDNNSTWEKIAGILKKLKEEEPEAIRYAVLGYMSAVLLNGKQNPRAISCLEFFSENFYDSKFSGVVLACAQVME